MTLEQLRIFVAVAEREHVTAAARALHLTQSAVSNALAALEGRHGVRLFDRVGRGVVLNETGRVFLAEARAVLSRAEAADAALTDLGALRRGRLTISASQTIASYWLPTRLAAFHAAHPGVELDVTAGNTRSVAHAVREGVAELGFVEGAVDDSALSRRVVGTDRLVLVGVPAFAPKSNALQRPEVLMEPPWILREPGSGTRSTLEQALTAAGLDPTALHVAMTLPTNEALLTAAQTGAGITALSESVAADALAAGRLARLAFELPTRDFTLLRHKARYHSRAAEAFSSMLGFGSDVS